jgi:1,4-dihydroxy-6-naphthoate synthase
MDLGHFFETSFDAPIPLGGIIARKDRPHDEIKMMDTLIQESVQYAFKNSYETLPEFVKSHSQEMSEQVMRQHINLYVNDFSIQMGEVGKNAIAKLEQVYNQIVGS